jgi:integrase
MTEEFIMEPKEQIRFDKLYQRHLRALKLQGLSDKTIDAYSRGVRRIAQYYDCCPDRLATEQLEDYFAELVESHSWSTVKVDRNGLQFFYKHVLKQDWSWLNIIKAPKIQSLPDILTLTEVDQLIGATCKLRYRVFLLTTYSMGLRLGETLALEVGDIDGQRQQVHIRRGKGHKDRLVPLPDLTYQALRALWCKHRNPRLLFPSPVGSPKCIRNATTHMDRGGAQAAMRAVVDQCGIKKNIHPFPSSQPGYPLARTGPESASYPEAARPRQPHHHRTLYPPDRRHRTRHRRYYQSPACRSSEAVIMALADLIHQYLPILKVNHPLLPGHLKAIQAILRCRTPDAGQIQLHCTDCSQRLQYPRSCGHRSCPGCQNHEASLWLDRQRAKLLPVEYFMVTFTLPYELRALAWRHQTVMYNILFATAASTLKDFGLNPKLLGADIGLTAMLHTHSRRLDYHPHLHVIVPGGGVDRAKRQWKKKKGRYLFNEFALARVFRARFLAAMNAADLSIPDSLPDQWVVDCKHLGIGEPALQYLSRYLYRGVISEKDIVANREGRVTFRYVESNTGKTQYRTLKGEDFLWLVLQHVLPKGFRRVRDYGFLHGKAKKWLALVQLVLKVIIEARTPRPRPAFKCPMCYSPMQIRGFIRPAWQSG